MGIWKIRCSALATIDRAILSLAEVQRHGALGWQRTPREAACLGMQALVAAAKNHVFMILILFTTSYPYIAGGEQNFVEMEGKYLLDRFERVIVVPEKRAGARVQSLPGFEVDDSYADFLRSQGRLKRLFRGLVSGLVYAELLRKPGVALKPAYFERLIFFAGHAELTRAWLIGWLQHRNLDPAQCLLYTYWFTEPTLGLGLAKRTLSDLRLVTRAHRYDLYEEVNTPPYWPCRESALQYVDGVFAVSDDGRDYLCRKYPRFGSRVQTARLGIEPRDSISNPSIDGIYRIVSCSKLVPVKRVDLLMQGVAAAARRRPAQKFEWSHIGNGSLQTELDARLPGLPANVTARILTYLDTSAVFAFYRDHPADVFVNVSASEGTPVAIMEAISCGIPVVATNVGGNAEIVSALNGYLLPADPSPEQVADALLAHWDQPGERRLGSREMWESKYNARRNYPDFTERLVTTREQRPGMRIAYVALGIEPRNLAGGVGRKIKTQTTLWAELGHSVRLFALVPDCSDPDIYTYGPQSAVPVVKGLTRAASRARALRRLMDDVRIFQPDIIYLRAGAYIYPLHLLFRIAPVVMELNSNDVAQRALQGSYADWFNRLTRGILLSKASSLVGVTRELVDLPANRKYQKPSRVIGNGIDLRQYDPLPAPIHTRPVITLVGSPGMTWHGVDKLIGLAEICSDLNVQIVGYTARDIGVPLPMNVEARGFLDPAAVKDILRKTDVACGSLALHRNHMQEGSTLKVPEALAYGIPVLLGYHDADLAHLNSDCILELPNTEDNVVSNAQQIRSFAYRMLGRRVRREDVAPCIDQRLKEEHRLELFADVLKEGRHVSG